MLNISVSFRFGTSPIEVVALQGISEDVDMPHCHMSYLFFSLVDPRLNYNFISFEFPYGLSCFSLYQFNFPLVSIYMNCNYISILKS
jgi:hypothetical protein